MKLTQLLLTVGLVVGGIFVYDTVRDRPEVDVPLEVVRWGSPTSDASDGESPPLLQLQGTGDDIWRADIERRLEGLERRREASTRLEAVRDAGGDGTVPASSPGADAGTSPDVSFLPDVDDPSDIAGFDPEDVETFRTLLESVERRRRHEAAVRGIRRALDRMGVTLTDAQRSEVIKATLAFRGKIGETLRGLPRGEEGREERKEAIQKVRDDYTHTLYDVVPAAEADRIAEGVGRAFARESRGPRSRGPRPEGGSR